MKTENLQNSSTGDDELSIALLKTIRHRMLAAGKKKRRKLRTRGGVTKPLLTQPKGFHFITFHEFSRTEIDNYQRGKSRPRRSLAKAQQMASTQRQKKTQPKNILRFKSEHTTRKNSTSTTRRENLIHLPPARNNEGDLHRSPPNSLSSRNQTKRKTAQIIR